ncbi:MULTISPECIES: GAF domain-containing protein [Haloferax]|nr:MULTISPECIES: GAF domain-containing protein [Haloferax]
MVRDTTQADDHRARRTVEQRRESTIETDGGQVRPRPEHTRGAGGADHVRVLLVDDDESYTSLVAAQVRRVEDGFEFEFASSAAEAREVFDETDIDCVVSDYEMHPEDGISLLTSLRERDSGIPLVLLTGRRDASLVESAIDAGATDVMFKDRGSAVAMRLANRIRHAVEQRRTRQQAERRARLSETVRKVGQRLVRASSDTDLFEQVCETLVDDGHCSLAWVGEPNPETNRVDPVAMAGTGTSYVENMVVETDGGAQSRGPIGRVLRSGRPQATADIETDPSFEPWRDDALEHGLRSSLSVPLTRGDEEWGVLTVYAERPNVFDGPERELLVELSNDIAHALHRIELQSRLRGYKEAVNRAGHTIYLTDQTGTIQWVNTAFEQVTGYDADEVVGKNASVLKSGVHGSAFYQNLWQTILDGDVWRGRIINRKKNGDEYVANQTIAPIENDRGERYAFVAVNADVTGNHERIRSLQSSQRRLARRNERLGTFADSVAHDLRDPLAIAGGNLELAKEGDIERLDTVSDQLDRMNELVDSMLDLAKKGKDTGELEPVSVAEAAEEAWRHVASDDATLSLDIDPNWELMADESRLVQLLENLFRNAVEHSDDGVRVTVGRCADGFTVADDGPGFPDDVADNPWAVGVSGNDGAGLGLALVERIASGHCWTVTLNSDLGGSVFEFRGVEVVSD